MSTALALGVLIAGIALVIPAADALVDGLLSLGRRLGVAPFVLTVLLSGLELENLAAGIAANAKGLGGAAAGTFLGGTTFLALAVAGLGGLASPMRSDLPRSFALWTAAAPVPLVLVSLDGEISRPDGALLVIWFVLALAGVARSGRSQQVAQGTQDRKRGAGAKVLAALAVLTAGGWMLGEGLRSVVRNVGVSPTLLGNTAIAASVEAEEVARVVAPARRGRPELALGNIAGTIVHFLGLNAGVIALVRPLSLDTASLHLHLPVAAASTVLLALILGVGRRLGRIEGAGLCALYVGYVVAAIAVA